jgi:hypothetical protein
VSSASSTPGLLPHVGARESRVHGDEHPWRRPLACGKTGTKVLSERASCPRGIPWMLEKCEGTLQGVRPWRRPQVLRRVR